MKNYRYIGVYEPEDWETDKDWRAKRLQFIWDFRLFFPEEYMELKMYNEKNDFYDINDDEVSRLAAHYDSYSKGELNTFKSMSIEKLSEELDRIEYLKKYDREKFFLKNNSNLYCYIIQHRLDDITDYKMNW